MVLVEYKPLLSGRPFMFNSHYAVVHNVVIDARTPKVVSVKNTTCGIVRISKRQLVGKIKETEDSGYFTCSWGTAFTALTVGIALTTIATMVSNIDLVSLATK